MTLRKANFLFPSATRVISSLKNHSNKELHSLQIQSSKSSMRFFTTKYTHQVKKYLRLSKQISIESMPTVITAALIASFSTKWATVAVVLQSNPALRKALETGIKKIMTAYGYDNDKEQDAFMVTMFIISLILLGSVTHYRKKQEDNFNDLKSRLNDLFEEFYKNQNQLDTLLNTFSANVETLMSRVGIILDQDKEERKKSREIIELIKLSLETIRQNKDEFDIIRGLNISDTCPEFCYYNTTDITETIIQIINELLAAENGYRINSELKKKTDNFLEYELGLKNKEKLNLDKVKALLEENNNESENYAGKSGRYLKEFSFRLKRYKQIDQHLENYLNKNAVKELFQELNLIENAQTESNASLRL